MAVQEADTMHQKIIKEKLIAQLSVKHGTARRKALEYINNLKELNLIKESWDNKGTYLELVKIEQSLEL